MERNKRDFYSAAGYDVVARKKIKELEEKVGGGSGGGSTPDWNQNNEAAADYIRNRPFYKSDPQLTTVVPKTEGSTFSVDGMPVYGSTCSIDFKFSAGDEFIVNFNDRAYNCVAYSLNGIGVVGNAAMVGLEGGNGEPFLILSGQGMFIPTTDNHTLEVLAVKIDVVKIPSEYLSSEASITFINFARTDSETVYTLSDDEFGKVRPAIDDGKMVYAKVPGLAGGQIILLPLAMFSDFEISFAGYAYENAYPSLMYLIQAHDGSGNWVMTKTRFPA